MVAPLAREHEAAAILASLDWPIAPAGGAWRPVARAYFTSFIGVLAPAAILTLIGVPFLGPVAMLWLAGAGLAIGMRWLDWRRTRYVLDGGSLFVETGWWRRRRSIVPARKIQSIDLTESWWTRLFGICTLRLGIAGGSGFSGHRVPALTRPQAEALRAELLGMSQFACGVERSLTGPAVALAPCRRRRAWPRPGRPAAAGARVEEADLARHRAPTIRDFLPDPSDFKDMDKAAARLADAVEAGETIAIFGDYDVDGATSAALLTILLRRLGVEPMIYIPDRLMEGYGPSGAALVELKRRGREPGDHGRLRRPGVRRASGSGRRRRSTSSSATIISAPPSLPVALALINPNRLDESDDRRGARPCRRRRHGLPARRRTASRAAPARAICRRGRSRSSSTCSTSSRLARSPTSPG